MHQCEKGIQQFSEVIKDSLENEVTKILGVVDNPSMKEVKGLEDRLSGLEQLMYGATKIVQEQGDMAKVNLINLTFLDLIEILRINLL